LVEPRTTTAPGSGTVLSRIPAPMTLRIMTTGSNLRATVKIDGRLTGEEAPELRRVCAGGSGRPVIDLTDLQSADREGGRGLRAKGADLVGASPYIQLLLDRGHR